jgi:Domain of unknown function (DUF222)/HNH endonuclease
MQRNPHDDQVFEDTAHQDAAHQDAAHQDAAHEDAAHIDAAHIDAAHIDAAHIDAAHDRRRIAELADEIAELSAHIDAATARLLVAIAEFDQRQGWADGFASCAHWLSWRVGIDRSTAREKVRVARALTNLPCITRALGRGQVSYSKVREVTRVATSENEAELVELCQAGTASHVQRIVRAYRRCEQAELDTAERQREGRYLSLRTDDDGMLVLEGRLPPEVGALLTRALEAAEQELRGRAGGASAEASASESGASAEASARETAGTLCQRRADALGLVAERALVGAGKVERGEPCQVVLHVDAAVLSGQLPEGGRCHLEHGPTLAAETARRLSCDAPTVTLIEDESGQPLDVGRKTRRVSTALFRALRARDQTCQFPGCDHTSVLTPHHVTHWATGGTTNKDNLCLLCPFCHWRVHEGGCEVRGRAPDTLTFFTPAGIELKARPDSASPLPEDPVGALKALHVAEGLDIRPETNVIWWQGERWDLGWAVESLLSYKESS